MRVGWSRVAATVVVAFVALSVVSCSGTSHTVAPPGRSTSASAAHPPTDVLNGKFKAYGLQFPTSTTGYLTVGGFPGDGNRLYGWFERSVDGGRSWSPLPLATGDAAPASGAHMAWVDADHAWSSVVSYATHSPVATLYFTSDGGRTWRVEREPFWVADIVVSHGSSWLIGTSVSCPARLCPETIYAADRVGSPLTRLPAQPSTREDISDLVRIGADTAAAVLRDLGSFSLVTTEDAGRSWQERALPCGRPFFDAQLMASPGGRLYLSCTAASGSTCSSCGLVTIYRSDDLGVSWTRSAAHGTRGFLCCVEDWTATSARQLWLLQAMPDGSGALLRSTDGARSFTRVLDMRHTGYLGPLAAHDDAVWAVAMKPRSPGAEFVVYHSVDDGRSWQVSPLPAPRGLPRR